jgi:proteasome lid subunit RPN8/RPN11
MSAATEAEIFAPRGRSATAVLFQPRPGGNPRYRVYVGPPGALSVFIHRRALDQISRGAHSAFPNETIGVLLGRPCRDEQGTYAIVEVGLTAEPKEHEGTGGMVRISSQGRSMLHRRAGQLHPVLETVGWWHSHPHGPARYSSVDLDEQATYPKPYHVGIVVAVRRYGGDLDDPGDDGPFGVYIGPGGLRLWPQESISESHTMHPQTVATTAASGGPPDSDAPAWQLEDETREPKADLRTALFACALMLAIAIAIWVGLASQGGNSIPVGGGEGTSRVVIPPSERGGALRFPALPEGVEER